MNYKEELRKLSLDYHRKARKVNWKKLASTPPRVRPDYGKRING